MHVASFNVLEDSISQLGLVIKRTWRTWLVVSLCIDQRVWRVCRQRTRMRPITVTTLCVVGLFNLLVYVHRVLGHAGRTAANWSQFRFQFLSDGVKHRYRVFQIRSRWFKLSEFRFKDFHISLLSHHKSIVITLSLSFYFTFAYRQGYTGWEPLSQLNLWVPELLRIFESLVLWIFEPLVILWIYEFITYTWHVK